MGIEKEIERLEHVATPRAKRRKGVIMATQIAAEAFDAAHKDDLEKRWAAAGELWPRRAKRTPFATDPEGKKFALEQIGKGNRFRLITLLKDGETKALIRVGGPGAKKRD